MGGTSKAGRVKKLQNEISVLIMLLSNLIGVSQSVGISSTGTAPDGSAALDISSTNKGTLLTRLTSSQRNAIASPATGLWIYNTDCNLFNFYNGSAWVTMDGSATLGTTGAISGNTPVCSGASGETYSITAVTGATNYTWTVPTGSTITAGQGTNSITVTFGSTSGNISVTASNSCETGNTSALAITIQTGSPSTPGSITGPTNNCPHDVTNYSISAVTGANSYTWTVDDDITINSGQSTTSINVTYGSTNCWNGTNIEVTASNACGTSAAQTLTVNYPSTMVYINENGSSVSNGATSPSIVIGSSITVAELSTYHWNGGAGSSPGTLALYNTGTMVTYGPWAASGRCSGDQTRWFTFPNATIPAGTYQVVDSDAGTWSKNAGSGNLGFTYLKTCP